jgi:hypothetical protein
VPRATSYGFFRGFVVSRCSWLVRLRQPALELSGEESRLSVYTDRMQLHTARLCLDCEEIHEGSTCPVCTSESFAFITRWIPAPERRKRPRPEPVVANDVETYRQLLASNDVQPKTNRWLKGGVLVAAVSLAGLLWRRAPDNNRVDRPAR